MTTKQIDYCIGLAHTLNFSRAADNMFVSQPTFSYQIRLLQKTEGENRGTVLLYLSPCLH